MVLLIIIPILYGYFFGGIPHFQTFATGIQPMLFLANGKGAAAA